MDTRLQQQAEVGREKGERECFNTKNHTKSGKSWSFSCFPLNRGLLFSMQGSRKS